MCLTGVKEFDKGRFIPPRVRNVPGFCDVILACQFLLALPLYLNILIGFPPFWLAAVLALLPFGVRLYAEGRLSRRTPFDWPIGIFVVGLLVGTIVSPDVLLSLRSLQTFVGAIFVYYGLVNNSNRGNRYWFLVIGILFLIAFTMFLLFVEESTSRRFLPYNSWFLNWGSSWPKFASVNIQINSAGLALAIIIPIFLSLGLFIRNGQRLLGQGLAALLALALFLTGSGSAWLAALTGGVFIILWWRPKMLVPLVGTLLITCLIFMVNYKHLVWLESALSYHNLLGRFAVWSDTLPQIFNKPITGMGLGSWYRENGVYALQGVDNIHNSYIQLFWDTGLFGVVAGIMAFVAFIKIVKCFVLSKSSNGWYALAAGASASVVVLIVSAIYESNYAGVIGTLPNYDYVAWPVIFIFAAFMLIAKDKLAFHQRNNKAELHGQSPSP